MRTCKFFACEKAAMKGINFCEEHKSYGGYVKKIADRRTATGGWELCWSYFGSTPGIIYTCPYCHTVTNWVAGKFGFIGRIPNPNCCGRFNPYPMGVKECVEHLNAKTRTVDPALEGKEVSNIPGSSMFRPQSRLVAHTPSRTLGEEVVHAASWLFGGRK